MFLYLENTGLKCQKEITSGSLAIESRNGNCSNIFSSPPSGRTRGQLKRKNTKAVVENNKKKNFKEK